MNDLVAGMVMLGICFLLGLLVYGGYVFTQWEASNAEPVTGLSKEEKKARKEAKKKAEKKRKQKAAFEKKAEKLADKAIEDATLQARAREILEAKLAEDGEDEK